MWKEYYQFRGCIVKLVNIIFCDVPIFHEQRQYGLTGIIENVQTMTRVLTIESININFMSMV